MNTGIWQDTVHVIVKSWTQLSACNAGDMGLIPGLGRSPGGGHGNPLQYSCLENPQGQRSLQTAVQCCNASDMTE